MQVACQLNRVTKWQAKWRNVFLRKQIMNYTSHPKIRAAVHQSEKIDVRGERFIPLQVLKAELDKRRIEKSDFQDYLRIHAPSSMSSYVDEVCKKLFDCPDTISRDERFLITSGLC